MASRTMNQLQPLQQTHLKTLPSKKIALYKKSTRKFFVWSCGICAMSEQAKSRSQSFSDIDQDNKSSRSSSPRSNNSSGGESKKAGKRGKQPPQEGESAENSVKLLSAYVSKFGDNFCDGTRLLSLNTHSLRYINARLREHLRKKKGIF